MTDIHELLAKRYRLLGAGAPLFYEQPLHIVKGEGVWLWDAEGRRYLDVYNNVPNVGHCHPQVVAAMHEQAQLLNVHSRYLHERVLQYSERLTALHDASLDMACIVCSGTEANELALRMARYVTGGQGMICSNATYHGNSEAVDELATLFHAGKSHSKRVKAVPYPQTYRPISPAEGEALGLAYVDTVRQAIEEFAEQGIKLAGILFCPVFANEGLPNVPANYMREAIQLVRNAGGVYIADEVQSGFARTGKHMWGYQHAAVVPDIATMGKPMGNGHPLAGVVCRADILNAFRAAHMYFNTFGGNPVQCAVGMAVLDVIEQEQLQANAAAMGAYLKQGMQNMQARHELIGDVRGHGLFLGVELVQDRTLKTAASDEAKHIINAMKDKGVLISRIGVHDNILKMRPPLCFSQANADLLLSSLDDVLTAM